LVSVPLLAVGLLLPNVLAASLRPVGAAWLSFGVAAVATAAAVVGILLGGIREIYVWQAVATAALLAAALVYFKVRLHLPFHDSSASLVKEIRGQPDIIPTAIAAYTALVGSALSLLVVRYVTVQSLGTAVGGLLQSILSMVLAVSAVLVAMASRYLSPVLNRPGPLNEKFAIFDMFRRRQLMILIALSVPLVLFAKFALLILFSSKFTIAAAWLPAFLVWQLLYIQTNVQLQLLFALDELWVVTLKSIAGGALSIFLCVALIPAYGLDGAAAAMIWGTALALAIGAIRLRRHGYVMEPSSVLLGVYAAVAILAAPFVMQGDLWGSIPMRFLACVLLIGGLWWFLSTEEKAAVRGFGRRPMIQD
jgi:O-antigen/teichoic acid export membrane protein